MSSAQQIPDATSYALVYIEAIILGMLAAGMPAYFAMDHTRDREVAPPLLYWSDVTDNNIDTVLPFSRRLSWNALHQHVVLLLQIKCRSTLRISGLVPSAYWCGQAAVDVPFYYLILSSMTAVLFCFHTGSLLTSSNLTAVVCGDDSSPW